MRSVPTPEISLVTFELQTRENSFILLVALVGIGSYLYAALC